MPGRFVRSASLATDLGLFPNMVGRFADGALVVAAGLDLGGTAIQRPGAAWRDSTTYLLIDPAGGVRDTLGRFPGTERYTSTVAGGRGIEVETVPFGRHTVTATADATLYVGTGDDYSIQKVEHRNGRAEPVISDFRERVRITAADRAEYWEKLISASPSASPPPEVPYPEVLRPYDALIVDAEGDLWVKDAELPRHWEERSRWRVYSPAGELRAVVELPPRLRVHAIGTDWILGTGRAADQVEHVRLYGLVRD
ncbi:hypothetical protein BH23GEM3_BH23GEM3_26150 [soil metagenome]